jgi:two-component system OmpR family response regulator
VRILIVEDDQKTAAQLSRGLSESGHIIDHVADGETALALVLEGIFDLILVDRMLPGQDGIAVVKELRGLGVSLPILMISAVAATGDRVEGLLAGCDDYLTKPYAFAEVAARIEALHRRLGWGASGNTLQVGPLTLSLQLRCAFRAGRTIELQKREFLLLECMMRHAGQVVTRSMLLECAWNYDFEPRSNIIDMHIHRLRRKIDDGFEPRLILTVPGVGYRLG